MPISVRRVALACSALSLLFLGVAVPLAPAGATGAGSLTARTTGTHHSASAASVSTAAAGAGWIARDLSPNGALVDAESHLANPGDTANAILALVATGVGANQVKDAVTWLGHNFASYVSQKGVDNPGRLALVMLAAIAAGADPLHFGGTAKSNDLLARLEATEQMTGSSAGGFGTGPNLNAFSDSLALLALAAAKVNGKAIRLAETYLAGLQCPDGGWEYNRISATRGVHHAEPEELHQPGHEHHGSCCHGDRRRGRAVFPQPCDVLPRLPRVERIVRGLRSIWRRTAGRSRLDRLCHSGPGRSPRP